MLATSADSFTGELGAAVKVTHPRFEALSMQESLSADVEAAKLSIVASIESRKSLLEDRTIHSNARSL